MDGLLTDLYELTMAAAYHAAGLEQEATFELFVRELPEPRNFLIAGGLEQALDHLETVGFGDDDVAYLSSLGLFERDFLDYLREFRFTGEVWAAREGEAVFASEPLLAVTAPIIEAQIVETFLLTTVLFQTMVASKAARVALACGQRPFVDFSGRRDHGSDAGVKAARAAYIGGAAATSNVLAGKLYGIPLSGTMAHSYVTAFANEIDAFRAYARAFPNNAVLLIDTYDTEEGARRAVEVGREIRIQGVRLDSGDLGALAKSVRAILDEGGLGDLRIVVSGDLDEYRITELLASGAPIDSFGVGTRLGTSDDAPSLGGVYKLVEDTSGPKMKRSPGKETMPGRKQVHRFAAHDVLALRGEFVEGGRPLLRPVMEGGRVVERESLVAIRERAAASVAALPPELLALDRRVEYPVQLSPGLRQIVG